MIIASARHTHTHTRLMFSSLNKPIGMLLTVLCSYSTVHAAVLAMDYRIDGNIFDPSQTNVHNQLGSIDYASGDIEFNTDTGEVHYNGTLIDSNNSNDTYYNATEGSSDRSLMVFNFESINLTSGVTILVSGSNGLALISQGDVTIGADIDVSGEEGSSWQDPAGYLPGSAGKDLSLVSKGALELSGTINTNGGKGGNALDFNFDGDQGHDAGELSFAGIDVDLEDAVITAKGGDGGDESDAFGIVGDIGSGADGGIVIVQAETYTPPTTNPDVGGGSGAPDAGNPDGDPGSFPGLDPDNPTDPLDPEIIPPSPPEYLVPEPSSSTMLILASLGLLVHRKRKAA